MNIKVCTVPHQLFQMGEGGGVGIIFLKTLSLGRHFFPLTCVKKLKHPWIFFLMKICETKRAYLKEPNPRMSRILIFPV